MERFSSRTLDELGRIVLHGELRNKLGLKTGGKFTLTVFDSIVILQSTDSGSHEINEFGMITIPAGIRQTLDWGIKDEIAVYYTDSLLILKRS